MAQAEKPVEPDHGVSVVPLTAAGEEMAFAWQLVASNAEAFRQRALIRAVEVDQLRAENAALKAVKNG